MNTFPNTIPGMFPFASTPNFLNGVPFNGVSPFAGTPGIPGFTPGFNPSLYNSLIGQGGNGQFWGGQPWGQIWGQTNGLNGFGGLPFGGFTGTPSMNNISGQFGGANWTQPTPFSNFGGFPNFSNGTLPVSGFGINPLNWISPFIGAGMFSQPYGSFGGSFPTANTISGFNGIPASGLNTGFNTIPGFNVANSTPWFSGAPGFHGVSPFGMNPALFTQNSFATPITPWSYTNGAPTGQNVSIPNAINTQGGAFGQNVHQPISGQTIPYGFNGGVPFGFSPAFSGVAAPFIGQPWGYYPGFTPTNSGVNTSAGVNTGNVPFQQNNVGAQGLCRDAA
ncbi:MAG: hypothetical protein EA379_11610 [Phycisphaerales bacterium]|nr:MAG: hypothetical protein EA379_11610 [Phycisphaerales bacterium]